MERVEVLDRVKGLLLLPKLEMATTKQVAEFYGVSRAVISMLISNNKGEIQSDGYFTMKGRELVSKYNLHSTPQNGYLLLEDGSTVAYRGTGLFPKRAILRVGMLLRDSEVAKEVRTQLLNIEEKVTTEVKTVDLNEEILLKVAVADAHSAGYMHRK
ncbi:hypothetical protein U9M49_07955 [Cytobacillus sp. OWB-43]|uniref:hypothetical protein n=1 Tax=Cytobacillus sp. OWB-43 TaxID=3108468 RepID=UPI002AFDEE8C|nr:hypothetical protein [Cytobacillus sp. OWB-43]MEA1853021.1 hypothetical protein [Cytobacillus sp. OWB-43]